MTDKPRCIVVFLAERAIMQGSMLSIINITSQTVVSGVPYTSPLPLCVVTYWKGRRNTDFDFSIRITGPGYPGIDLPMTGKIGPVGACFETAVLGEFTFPEHDEYLFEVVVDGEVVASETHAVLPVI